MDPEVILQQNAVVRGRVGGSSALELRPQVVTIWLPLLLVIVVGLTGCSRDGIPVQACDQLAALVGDNALWRRDREIVRIATEMGLDTSPVLDSELAICAKFGDEDNEHDGHDDWRSGGARQLEEAAEHRRSALISVEQQIVRELRRQVTQSEAEEFYLENLDSFERLGTIKIRVIRWENGKAGSSTEQVITAENVRLKQEGDDRIISTALELYPGDAINVYEAEGRYVQVICLEREPNSYLTFEEVKQAASQQLALRRLEEKLSGN